MRITVAKWFTPSDSNISEIGITPDIEIERSVDDYENGDDTQLEAAIDYINEQIE